MRAEVEQLVSLGPLPAESIAEPAQLDELQRRLEAISKPVVAQEVEVLLTLFGPDDTCFGLAWTLLHLVETAENEAYVLGLMGALPIMSVRSPDWTRRILGRVFNSVTAFQALLSAVVDASSEQTTALDATLDGLRDRNPERFGAKADLVRARLRRT